MTLCPHRLGVVQGMITGIRGLCNGLGPALYGFIFYIFHVELKELPMTGTDLGTNTSPQHHFEQVKSLAPPSHKLCDILSFRSTST